MHQAPLPPTRWNDDIPADLQEIILRCLEKDPKARFQTATEIEHALVACHDVRSWNDEQAHAWWREHRSSSS